MGWIPEVHLVLKFVGARLASKYLWGYPKKWGGAANQAQEWWCESGWMHCPAGQGIVQQSVDDVCPKSRLMQKMEYKNEDAVPPDLFFFLFEKSVSYVLVWHGRNIYLVFFILTTLGLIVDPLHPGLASSGFQ